MKRFCYELRVDKGNAAGGGGSAHGEEEEELGEPRHSKTLVMRGLLRAD